MLEVAIKKKLGKFELNIEFCVQNEAVALLGASGCGKSITLKCIAGIETPDEGYIILNGKVLFDSKNKINLPSQVRRTGYLFQNYALFPNMTVKENIAFGIYKNSDKDKLVKKYIDKLRLSGLEDKRPAQLSGGQQQRTALARMLAFEAEIIMFDEPLSALDSFLKWELEQELLEVFADVDKTILYVSHDRGEAYRLCEKIIIMEQGKLVDFSEKHSLFQNPTTVTGTILTGCKNIDEISSIKDGYILAKGWQVEFKIPDKFTFKNVQYVAIRSHLLNIGSHGDNVFNAEIVEIIEDVFNWIVLLKLSPTSDRMFRWVLNKKSAPPLTKGALIEVSIPNTDVIFLEH